VYHIASVDKQPVDHTVVAQYCKKDRVKKKEQTMAASSGKQPSPSNQSVSEAAAAAAAAAAASAGGTGGGVDNGAAGRPKDPPPAAAAADNSAKASAGGSTVEPTYEDSEKSEQYVLAKALLNDGDFEQALAAVEEGIEQTRAVLMSLKDVEEAGIELHPSLAPFHYLYGTTLLYQIEESDDNGFGQSMTVADAAQPQAETGADGATADPAAAFAAAMAASAPEEADASAAPQPAPPAEDMEIAWENLDTARAIVQAMDQPCNEKLQLDLAQIYLREGDLQRLNGRYDAAVEDYASCLSLRQQHLGPYDRKIADAHYNLALAYGLQVAEARKDQHQEQEDPSGQPQQQHLSPAQLESKLASLRGECYQHYLCCAKAFCGQIAFLCGEDPKEFFAKAGSDLPAFKTTGEEEEAGGSGISPKLASLQLQSFRKRASELTPSSVDGKAQVEDLLDLLQEIQETIDEAETSEEGVQEVTQMKEAISAAAAAAASPQKPGASGGDAVTTTTGFGSAQVSAAAAQPINTMMVKKKPKKRDAEEATASNEEDSKPAAKRVATE